MTKAEGKIQAAGPGYCAAISGTMIRHFCARLEAEAKKAGGSLTAKDIQAIADRFLRDGERFQAVYQKSYDDCSRAREAMAWDQARRFPFDRILIKRFSHLFPARSGDEGAREGGVLSRRVIPGFNIVLNKMIGPYLYDQCQSKAQAIIDRHRDGPQVDWEGVYDDPEARSLANDVLIVVAHYFSNFDKRRDWFIDIVNANLAPAQPGAPDEQWQLTEPVFQALLKTLFAELKEGMASNPRQLRERYGDGTFETLKDIFARLNGAS